jgi:hypothetical protein
MSIAGRYYARVYDVERRGDLRALRLTAVEVSGGPVLHSNDHRRAPIYLGVKGARDARLELLICPFRRGRTITRNRPADESKEWAHARRLPGANEGHPREAGRVCLLEPVVWPHHQRAA